jgi:HNH endonuclease
MWGPSVAQNDVDHAESPWQRAHRVLQRLARERAAADVEQGRWLLAALRSAAHLHLGFGSFHEYVERLFGYCARTTQERLRVAEALEQLPQIARSLAQGQLSWSAARELTRVAIADTEHDWLRATADKTVRQIEALIAGAAPGDLPSSPRDPALCPRVLRFEVTAETYALFREAVCRLRRQSDTRLDDDALLLTMARAALQGPDDEGRSSYQVSLSVCPECGRGAQVAAGELVPVSPEITDMATCDAQQLPRDPHVGATHDTRVDATPDAHVGANAPHPARAKQTIPPARRREAMQRDRGCCRVPGCRNATFVDVHHITPRGEGGDHDVANLIVLCAAHHRAVHRGELVIEGSNADSLHFRHADGSRYGGLASPTQIDVQTKVFKALCNLGFREGQVRRVLDGVRREAGAGDLDFDGLLRRALASLTKH